MATNEQICHTRDLQIARRQVVPFGCDLLKRPAVAMATASDVGTNFTPVSLSIAAQGERNRAVSGGVFACVHDFQVVALNRSSWVGTLNGSPNIADSSDGFFLLN